MDLSPGETPRNAYDPAVWVDGANGVGGEKLGELMKLLRAGLTIHVRNSGKDGEGILNDGVGADFVQKEKAVPGGFGADDAGRRSGSSSSSSPLHLLEREREREGEGVTAAGASVLQVRELGW